MGLPQNQRSIDTPFEVLLFGDLSINKERIGNYMKVQATKL